jgi:hypothetical protein
MIESYKFGQMTINKKIFHSDLIIFQDHIDDKWWRIEGHNLHIDDIQKAINEKPEIIIIGTGFYGLMKVSSEIKEYLESLGIKLIVKKTKDACDDYNNLHQNKKIIAAFHLTC